MTFDCFTFFNELDLLEIRLNVLDPYVDYFIIGESKQTFSGKEKPLYYDENKERFKKWWPKIIVVESPAKEFSNAFERSFYQKENLMGAVAKRAAEDDIIYFGDIDEIWKPQTITDNQVYKLRQLNYCYYLNNRSSEDWRGTVVGKWKNIAEKGFNWHRANPDNIIENGGWHFTNLGGAEQIKKKLEAYDHQEFNTDEVKSQIEKRIENGEDYVGRRRDWLGKEFSFYVEETDLPEYVIMNRIKYVAYFT